MRPLVMDFTSDAKARDINDEYMFGPAFLVAPVTEYKLRTRSTYLPAGSTWYALEDGRSFAGGTTIDAAAAYDQMPVFVRAGPIVPTGSDQKWIGEKPAATLVLHVYAGADGDFPLYEDSGATFDYEHGAFSQIGLHWDDAGRRLIIAGRTGSFPGMIANRNFVVQVIDATHPVGLNSDEAGKAVAYSGRAKTFRLP